MAEVSMEDITTSSGGGDMLDYYINLIRAFVPEATEIPEAAAEVKLLFEKASSIPEEDAWRMIPEKMGEWSARQLSHPVARQFIVNLMEAGHASPGEDASVGRWLLCFPWKYGSPDWIVDLEAGAMQSYVQPWARAVEANGGELWLGWKPVEIIVDRPDKSGQASGRRGRVAGVTAVNASNLVQVFRAPIVVSSQFGWDLPKLLDSDLLPADFIARAEATMAQQGRQPAGSACSTACRD
jgi:phytoene dehydrogenase-like protein